MSKETKEIFSENPIEDQWQILLRFSYSYNILKYFDDKFVKYSPSSPSDANLPEIISNSILQAYEYYNAISNSSLNISPLLLYYGTTNLLLATASLMSGSCLSVENHGMQLIIPKNLSRISDVEIKIRDPQNGSFNVFNKIFSNHEYVPHGEKWLLLESLGAILELKEDFENIYENKHSYAIPLQIIKKKDERYWRLNLNNLNRFNNLNDFLQLIPDFNKNYLGPIEAERTSSLIFRRKLTGNDLSEVSISGESYFQLSCLKNNKVITLPLVSKIFIGLYALGFLSRYHPEIWAPFIKNDSTGEKQLIEKFILLAKRYIPNICLNYLYGKNYIFLDQIKNVQDITEKTFKEELREMIREEITQILNKQR